MALRPGRLSGIRLRSAESMGGPDLRALFAEPGSAIAALTAEYRFLWDFHRTDDFDLRVIGGLDLRGGGYFQWIGYSDAVVVECCSNTYLPASARLTSEEEQRLVACGFTAPDDHEPNFWLEVQQRGQAEPAALAVVAALTTVFGVYAG